MATIITCELIKDAAKADFKHFPGSEEAIALGCLCPDQPLFPEIIKFDADCPLHQLKKVPN